jgi:amidase/6-aminohexanoate-cyclic-dimer hydrolase
MLAPTLSTEPVPIGFMAENIDGIAQFMADTALFNQTGQPAISLPLCWSASQLPIGIMFVAAFGNDALLMRIAGQLEQARPWWEKRAPVHS